MGGKPFTCIEEEARRFSENLDKEIVKIKEEKDKASEKPKPQDS